MRRLIKKSGATTVSYSSGASYSPSSGGSSSSTSSSSSSTVNYNTLLAKFNDYALKTELAQYVKASDLVSGGSSDVAVNALIQKLIDYDIFKYDGNGKKVIVTEFFPHLIAKKQNLTVADFTDGEFEIQMQEAHKLAIAAANLDILDYIKIPADNNNTVNQSSYKQYFSKDPNNQYFCFVSKNILNTPLITQTSQYVRSLKLIIDNDSLVADAGIGPLELTGQWPLYVEFRAHTSEPFTKNGITCVNTAIACLNAEDNGRYLCDGTITFTMPENVTLVTNRAYNNYTISASGNIITVTIPADNDNLRSQLTRQIIIADSATKRYVIKINGEALELPPNY